MQDHSGLKNTLSAVAMALSDSGISFGIGGISLSDKSGVSAERKDFQLKHVYADTYMEYFSITNYGKTSGGSGTDILSVMETADGNGVSIRTMNVSLTAEFRQYTGQSHAILNGKVTMKAVIHNLHPVTIDLLTASDLTCGLDRENWDLNGKFTIETNSGKLNGFLKGSLNGRDFITNAAVFTDLNRGSDRQNP